MKQRELARKWKSSRRPGHGPLYCHSPAIHFCQCNSSYKGETSGNLLEKGVRFDTSLWALVTRSLPDWLVRILLSPQWLFDQCLWPLQYQYCRGLDIPLPLSFTHLASLVTLIRKYCRQILYHLSCHGRPGMHCNTLLFPTFLPANWIQLHKYSFPITLG